MLQTCKRKVKVQHYFFAHTFFTIDYKKILTRPACSCGWVDKTVSFEIGAYAWSHWKKFHEQLHA